jgi:hypothetical protein
MSRTRHGSKGPGYEYWASRLHRQGETPGRDTKVATHKKERRLARYQLHLDHIRCDPPDKGHDARFLLAPGHDEKRLEDEYAADYFAQYEGDWDNEWMADLRWSFTAAYAERLR